MIDDLWPEGGLFDQISDRCDELGPLNFHVRGGQGLDTVRGERLLELLKVADLSMRLRTEYGWDTILEKALYAVLTSESVEDQESALVELLSLGASWYSQIQNDKEK